VLLTWNASTGAVSYNVKRGTSTGGEATVATVTAPTTTFTDAGLTNNTLYFYVVTAVNAAGESGASNEVSARPNIPPASPTGLAAAAGNAQVVLTWNANTETNLTGYNVYTAATQTGPFTQKVNTSLVTTTTFTNTGLTNGTTYFYIVRAVNNSGQESGNSNTVSAVPTNSAPAAPVILTPSKKTNSTAPTIVGTAAPSVTIKLFFNGVQESATTTSDAQGNWSLKPATKVDGVYTVTATATNSFGTSAGSNAITITVDTHVNPPSNVQAIAQNGQVNLTWTASPDSDIVGYEVWRSDGGGAYHKIHTGVVVGTSYFDFPLTNNVQYCYQVRAVDNTLQEGP
jgi:fibronectin type 3 domain-containing protein